MKFVTLSEASKALGVHKSTISRQVAKGIIPNRGTHERPMVDIDEARAARSGNIDTAKSSSLGLGLRDQPELRVKQNADAGESQQAIDFEDDGDAPAPSDSGKLSYNTARTAAVAVQAKRQQMEFMREIGQLVSKADVERAAEDHARILRDRLLGIPSQIAGALAVENDERKCAGIVSAALKECLTQLVEAMSAAPDGEGHE